MIRIIAGEFRHRTLKIPEAETCRPTMDRVREAVFSSIREKVPNSSFLDLFAGSGAVGLEALSRGAKKVIFNEIDKGTLRTLTQNVLTFDPKQQKTVIMRKDYVDALPFLSAKGDVFDIVYLDPPYALQKNKEIIEAMVNQGLLAKGALAVAEQTEEPEPIEGFALKIHKYGKKYIGTYSYLGD